MSFNQEYNFNFLNKYMDFNYYENNNIPNIYEENKSQMSSQLSVSDQEDFMHLIYDVVHIGVSVVSMKIRLENLSNKYGDNTLKNILNTVMKNEKYSTDKILPMKKCIYQYKNFQTNDEFFSKKLEMIKLLKSYGANMIPLTEDDITFLSEMGLINQEIKDYLTKNIS